MLLLRPPVLSVAKISPHSRGLVYLVSEASVIFDTVNKTDD
jgi:hypothetical protein